MITNKYGQEIRPGDFVIAAHQKGCSEFYIVRAIGDTKTRITLRRLYASDWLLDEETNSYRRMGWDRRQVVSKDTFVNFPEYVFKVSIEEFRSIDPMVREAYMNTRHEIMAANQKKRDIGDR